MCATRLKTGEKMCATLTESTNNFFIAKDRREFIVEENDRDTGTRRILVIEDEPSIAEVCLRVLTEAGLIVDISANCKAAQRLIEETSYDLLLVDIRTPEMDGKEFYQWLRECHPLITKQVIFTTGDMMREDTINFLKETHRPFLAKPFTIDELKTIVQQAINLTNKT